MPTFERPATVYAGSAGANRTKYQDDSANVPKRAISSIKMDGDFNYILDALNTINGYNASGVYTDLPAAVAQIRQTQLDVAALVVSGFISPSGTNVAAFSVNGTAWTSGKLPSNVFRDSAGMSVVGRNVNSTGSVADIVAGGDGYVLFRSGTTLTFGALPATKVTYSNTTSGLTATTVQAAIDEMDAVLDLVDPIGTSKPFFGAVAPLGHIFVYGQAISRTTYPRLFAALGTVHGVGDGTTTFNLPDLRSRSLFGKDDMGGVAANRITAGVSAINGATLGAVGGNEAMQQHLHNNTLNDPTHFHTYNSTVVSGGLNGSGNAGNSTLGSQSTQAASTGVTITNVNAGTGNSQNMPPAIIVNWIMRAA
jgi:microcystin-dependent protein